MDRSQKSIQAPPGGRLSSIRTSEGIIHVQTEFGSFPSSRVITSVMLNGAVLFKEATEWQKTYSTSEGFRDLERLINVQHQKIYEDTRKNVESGNLDNFKLSEPINFKKDQTSDIIEAAKNLDNSVLVEVLNSAGEILYRDSEFWKNRAGDKLPDMFGMGVFLSRQFGCGAFHDANLKTPEENFCWTEVATMKFIFKTENSQALLKQLNELASNYG
ncbi:MAG: hypothetical protein GF315_02960 [candidate division Zixibacteria bacterium]|nr:hypothetical protein [candidate division Zixibacteria bacterium]